MENFDQVRPQGEKPVSTGNWMLTFLIMAIPLVNFVMLFVWAFGSNTPPSKANWAKASLLWMLICFGFAILILVMLWGTLMALFSGVL
ncbi:MAG: hypothetical protein LBC84_09070 [Prevotellaceae bacterium]|jgi:Zn-dependent protease with chaperone function|nr:hypothetical protein [Prevotellaceae bacterium]